MKLGVAGVTGFLLSGIEISVQVINVALHILVFNYFLYECGRFQFSGHSANKFTYLF